MPVCQRARNPSRSFSRTRGFCLILRDVSCLDAVLSHDPKPIADAGVAHRSAARLSGLATNRFEERIPGRRHIHGKEQLNRRVKHVFLQCMNNLMFHFVMATPAVSLPFHCTNLRQLTPFLRRAYV